jgi:hypothetical protein
MPQLPTPVAPNIEAKPHPCWFPVTLTILLVGLFASPTVIAQNLLSTAEFQFALTTCAAGSTTIVDADLIGSIARIYDGDKTQGKAKISTGTFLDSLPAQDRLKGYELYSKCIAMILRPPQATDPRLLEEISKSLQPLRDIKVSYRVGIDIDGAEFAEYKNRLKAGVNEYLRKHTTYDSAPSFFSCPDCGFEAVGGIGGKIAWLRTVPRSKYLPDPHSEAFAYSALTFQVHVCLRRTPQQSPAPCDDYEGGDLRFPVRNPNENAGLNFSQYLEVDAKNVDIVVQEHGLVELQQFRRLNGKLLSVPDLAGAQIILYLQNVPMWRPRANEPLVIESYDPGMSRRTIKALPMRLELEVPGHRYTLTRPRLQSQVIDGHIYLYATFPATPEEMLVLERDCIIFEDGVRRCRAPSSPPILPPILPPIPESPNGMEAPSR